jgi:iron complex outermembrane receptor protein
MRFRTTLLFGVAAATLFGSGAACAATADATAETTAAASADNSTHGVGEIIVTARKREENLQQVPVAVTAQTGIQLERQGVRETTDLQRVVPSLEVVLSPSQNTSAVFSLRGQAAGDILLTLSQPVGTYEDTANIPHNDGLQGAFFDIDRVEVLKGPQGTLYGRNTTGGAINIVTRGADYAGVHGFAYGEGGSYDDWKIGGAINLPIVDDKLAMRLAYQHWNREGYGESLTTGQRLGDAHDDDVVRLSIRFDPASNFTSSTKFEYVNLNDGGYLSKLVAVPPGSPAAIEAGVELGNPLFNFTTPACPAFPISCTTIAAGTAALQADINNKNPFQTYDGLNVESKVNTIHVVEDATWDVTADIKLRSVTGFHHVLDYQTLDLDSTQFQLLKVGAGLGHGGAQPISPSPIYPEPKLPETDYDSYSQEFDLTGKSFGRLDWLVGAYGSSEHGTGAEPFIAFPDLSAMTGGAVVTTGTNSIGETTNVWGVYSQDDLHLTDKLSLTGGLRYSEERQTNAALLYTWANGVFTCTAPLPNGTSDSFPAPNNNPNSCPSSAAVGDPSSEKASGISYLASANFQFTPNILFYLKTSQGFRGGALQFRAPSFPPVQPEVAVDYEMGLKADFFDHRLRTNLAAYQTNYTNKQETVIITSVSGGTSTELFNAATARIKGVEGEITAVPVDGLSIYGNFTYLNGVYTKFGDANCGTPAQTFADKCALNREGASIDASGLPFLDPTWHYAIGGRYEHDVGPGKLAGQLDWAWAGQQNMSALNIDPLFSLSLQKSTNASIGLLNGRIDYTIPRSALTIALFATNLLDTHYQVESLFSGALGIGTAITGAPRMWGISITKTFGGG